MAYNFLRGDRDQPFLLPPDPRDWLPADHLAWFVRDVVDQLDLAPFLGAYRADGHGHPAYDPKTLLGVLLYAYAIGVRSSRQIQRRCTEDLAFRVLAGNQIPDHVTIARFRVRHEQALAGFLVASLKLCAAAGLVRLGVVALDGTKVAGNAADKANRTLAELVEEVTQILREVAETDQLEDQLHGAGRVDAVVLAGEVEVPVAVEVAVGPHRAEFEDGLGAVQAPAGAADVQAVADQVPARSLDHPGGDRPAGGQRSGVVEELLLGRQVADAGVDTATLAAGQSSVDGLLVDRGDGLGDPPGQDADRVGRDPRLGVRVTVGVVAPGGLPQVLQDVDEVDEDVDGHAAAGRFGADQVQLVAGAVDEHHPGAAVGRVAVGGLVEHRRDDLLAAGGDRAGQPLRSGVRADPAGAFAAAGPRRWPAGCDRGPALSPRPPAGSPRAAPRGASPRPCRPPTAPARWRRCTAGAPRRGRTRRCRPRRRRSAARPAACRLPARNGDRSPRWPRRTSRAPPPGRPDAAARGCAAAAAAAGPHRPGRC